MADRVGQQLGNYRLMHLLGHGGFAEVYLGEHIYLKSQAAIKVLHTQLADAADIENFRREAETIVSLAHPHIVRVLDFDVKDGVPFFVMDYAPNGTLRGRHPKGIALPLPMVVSYVKQVAEALQYAHEQKLIHRDVKPENMLLGRRNEVLLSDFGIALLAQSSRSQSTQEVVGTLAYMAPEQIQGKPRLASDRYSLGVVVYEWLCGECPFGGGALQLMYQHLETPPPSLREKVPTISPDVEQVVMIALAKDPRQRFGSVQAFATALEQASRAGQPQAVTHAIERSVPSQSPMAGSMVSPEGQVSPTLAAGPVYRSTWVDGPAASSGQPWQPVMPPLRRPEPAQRGISRRALVLGLGITGLAVAGGGLIWLLSSRTSLPPAVSTGAIHTSTPTPIPLGTRLYAHQGPYQGVNTLAWSPDSKRIASGGDDSTVQVWDALGGDGGHMYTYRGHRSGLTAVPWSPDGRRIASGSYDQTVQVWDAADGGHVYIYHGHFQVPRTSPPYTFFGVLGVAWSPDGRRIASAGGDKTVQVWDAADGSHVFTRRGHSDGVSTVAWSPDGRRIASGSYDKTVQVWDAVGGGHVFTRHGHSNVVSSVAWSPDGKRIASASWDRTVQVWDAVDGGNLFTYRGHSSAVNAMAWSPDGKRIASVSSDGMMQVWDIVTGGNLFTYRGNTFAMNAVAWSPNGKHIASGSSDGIVQVWVAG